MGLLSKVYVSHFSHSIWLMESVFLPQEGKPYAKFSSLQCTTPESRAHDDKVPNSMNRRGSWSLLQQEEGGTKRRRNTVQKLTYEGWKICTEFYRFYSFQTRKRGPVHLLRERGVFAVLWRTSPT